MGKLTRSQSSVWRLFVGIEWLKVLRCNCSLKLQHLQTHTGVIYRSLTRKLKYIKQRGFVALSRTEIMTIISNPIKCNILGRWWSWLSCHPVTVEFTGSIPVRPALLGLWWNGYHVGLLIPYSWFESRWTRNLQAKSWNLLANLPIGLYWCSVLRT